MSDLSEILAHGTGLTDEFLAFRRSVIVAILQNPGQFAVVTTRATKVKAPPPDMTKTPEERLATMKARAASLVRAINQAETREQCQRYRGHMRSHLGDVRRYCASVGIPMPIIPSVPENKFGRKPYTFAA